MAAARGGGGYDADEGTVRNGRGPILLQNTPLIPSFQAGAVAEWFNTVQAGDIATYTTGSAQLLATIPKNRLGILSVFVADSLVTPGRQSSFTMFASSYQRAGQSNIQSTVPLQSDPSVVLQAVPGATEDTVNIMITIPTTYGSTFAYASYGFTLLNNITTF